ncbi:putative proline-rich protein 21 [Hypomesus transpacificus]|uniref:putative proline-rich protein 21 n=1 Tax=Hypomesus transpacificus TaxID=137520 RepID=UPI001F077023|nr:putative proline-rich protein 21 [Hypomesus transpacificus]
MKLLKKETLKSPQCLVIHTETNDLHSLRKDTADAIKKMAEQASMEFPNTRIVVSTLPPRRSEEDVPPCLMSTWPSTQPLAPGTFMTGSMFTKRRWGYLQRPSKMQPWDAAPQPPPLLGASETTLLLPTTTLESSPLLRGDTTIQPGHPTPHTATTSPLGGTTRGDHLPPPKLLPTNPLHTHSSGTMLQPLVPLYIHSSGAMLQPLVPLYIHSSGAMLQPLVPLYTHSSGAMLQPLVPLHTHSSGAMLQPLVPLYIQSSRAMLQPLDPLYIHSSRAMLQL